MGETRSRFSPREARGGQGRGGLCRRPAFWFLVFLAGVVLFVLPFLPSSRPWPARVLYLYLFAVWAAIIFPIGMIARALPLSEPGQPEKTED